MYYKGDLCTLVKIMNIFVTHEWAESKFDVVTLRIDLTSRYDIKKLTHIDLTNH